MTVAADILVVFMTDVEGSTAHWQTRPGTMAASLDHLDATVERVVSRHGGALIKARGEGDSHFALFRQATSATRAAAELQGCLAASDWPDGVALQVRIALHAGELQQRGVDYAGLPISQAARLRSAAHGGQVICSRVIVELSTHDLGAGIRWNSLGFHRIRDLSGWTEVFQLEGPNLQASFPPLATLDKGVPPLAAIVMTDAIDTLGAVDALSEAEGEALLGSFSELFAAAFSACRGQWLQLVGDGCAAVFSDPAAAVQFCRAVRGAVRRLQRELRTGLHVGRVRFDIGGPYGVAMQVTWRLMRQSGPGMIALSPAAAALLEPADDFLIGSVKLT